MQECYYVQGHLQLGRLELGSSLVEYRHNSVALRRSVIGSHIDNLFMA